MMAGLQKQIRFCAFAQDMQSGMGVFESETMVFSGKLRFINLTLLVHALSQLLKSGGKKCLNMPHTQAYTDKTLNSITNGKCSMDNELLALMTLLSLLAFVQLNSAYMHRRQAAIQAIGI